MEQQNDERLDSLYSKISAIKNVTIDIHSDSVSQNRLLDQTTDSFDSFKNQLGNSVGRLGRSIKSGQGQGRLLLYVVGGIFALFVVWRLFFR